MALKLFIDHVLSVSLILLPKLLIFVASYNIYIYMNLRTLVLVLVDSVGLLDSRSSKDSRSTGPIMSHFRFSLHGTLL